MKPSIFLSRLALAFLASALAFGSAQAAPARDRGANPNDPILTDSRIRTLVYNENDVYPITTLYGYQSNVEFGLKEEIETISLGDRVSWQIIPSGRRLFIRAMTDNSRTNMTVITNRRAYQFDLRAASSGSARPDELVYVARFFYPDEEPAPKPDAMPVAPDQVMRAGMNGGYNYNYTFSGPDDIAPLKIYDDGSATYIKLRNTQLPATVGAVLPDGREQALNPTLQNGYLVVPGVGQRLSLRQGGRVICVFNEGAR